MSFIQRALRTMAEEHSRLSDFVSKFDNCTSSDDPKEQAVIETPKVVILTRNHGYFVMDQEAIVKHLRTRKAELESGLREYNLLGENVAKQKATPT